MTRLNTVARRVNFTYFARKRLVELPVRSDTGGDNYRVSRQYRLFPVLRFYQKSLFLHRPGLGPHHEVDTALVQPLQQELPVSPLHAGGQAVQHFDDGYSLAPLRQKLGRLTAGNPAADNDHAFTGFPLAGQDVGGIDDLIRFNTGDISLYLDAE